MITGSTIQKIDVGVCLISLKTGEFEAGLKGQTMEHLIILRGLGVKNLIICLNKTDLFNDPEILHTRLTEVKNILNKELLAIGYKNQKYVEISAKTGNGFDNFLNILDSIDNVEPSKVDNKLNNISEFTVKGLFFGTQLKTIGYEMIVHSNGQTCEAEIIDLNVKSGCLRVQDRSAVFSASGGKDSLIKPATSGQLDVDHTKNKKWISTGQAIVKVKLKSPTLINKNVIFRKNDDTVGIGLLI